MRRLVKKEFKGNGQKGKMIETGGDTFERHCIRSSRTLLENLKWTKIILAMVIQ